MSMIGEYARMTPAQLDRAIGDPEWALEFLDELIEAEADGRPELPDARSHDIDKAWHALDFLLRRIGFPVAVVHGEQEIPGAEDRGYGPPRYLTVERVRAAADAFATTPSAALTEGVSPTDLAKAEIYPTIVWERGESLEYVTDHYEALGQFFQAAACAGDAMLIWLD
ncbi:YfbM family protein [Streptomyces sp. NBC_01462]|uniref:YfbM family protein n=1 Tax=Streptomyces sp. NBC_01462 TaxID=2903876 RepID=UPI002E2F58A6|nr:YfbM family protein [Streptomyces sp. NBC_01462]